MTSIEKVELEAHQEKLTKDVKHLFEKYRSIFEWDVPDIDQMASDKLILGAIRQALDEIEISLADSARK